jgi:hypothetical protein
LEEILAKRNVFQRSDGSNEDLVDEDKRYLSEIYFFQDESSSTYQDG